MLSFGAMVMGRRLCKFAQEAMCDHAICDKIQPQQGFSGALCVDSWPSHAGAGTYHWRYCCMAKVLPQMLLITIEGSPGALHMVHTMAHWKLLLTSGRCRCDASYLVSFTNIR